MRTWRSSFSLLFLTSFVLSGYGICSAGAGEPLNGNSDLGAPAAPGATDEFQPRQWALKNTGAQTVTLDIDDLHTVEQTGTAGVDIGWSEAWPDIANQAKAPVLVAVIDSGIDSTHPDLTGRVSKDAWDFLLNSGSISDIDGHGTHVGGIIAANSWNGLGISGVAPSSVQLLPLRVLSADFKNFAYKGKLISDYVADAMEYAIAHHVQVINLSLGWPKIVDTDRVRAAFSHAISSNVLVVVSAGNDRKDEPTYPCSYPGVLCVGAVTNTGKLAVFSDFGGDVDILAPGDGIVSLFPRNEQSETLGIQGYDILSGTSQAAPFVAGIAATLRSIHPDMGLNELKARILTSAGAIPSDGAALYGLVNLPRAMNETPVPVYVPDFKSMPDLVVTEPGLQVSGSLPVQNLWASASHVTVKLTVNDVPAGQASAASLGSGQTLTLPWKYTFPSLTASSRLNFVLSISDSGGTSRSFVYGTTAARNAGEVTASTFPAQSDTSGDSLDWTGTNSGHGYSKLSPVGSYGSLSGSPKYFRTTKLDSAGAHLQIFDPDMKPSVRNLVIPELQQLFSVFRIDLNSDGNPKWAVVGSGKDSSGTFLEFYFLDPSLTPLDPGHGIWRITLDANFAALLLRNYATPGSWIPSDTGTLLPCFVTKGLLPPKDNFDGLDPRHYLSAPHFYFMAPVPAANPSFQSLELRALDNASFRSAHSQFLIVNVLPPLSGSSASPSAGGMNTGGIKMMVSTSDSSSAAPLLWQVGRISTKAPSPGDALLAPAPGWDVLSANGSVLQTNGDAGFAVVDLYDEHRGSLSWANELGDAIGDSEFEFSSTDNGIESVVSTFENQKLGRVWFVDSQFDLIAFHQANANSPVKSATFPLERDSSFPGEEFQELFSPVEVKWGGQSVPGVYVDSTLVRGDQVSVAVWDPSSGLIVKPLQYTIQIQSNCVQMNPIASQSGESPFALPLICKGNGSPELRLLYP